MMAVIVLVVKLEFKAAKEDKPIEKVDEKLVLLSKKEVDHVEEGESSKQLYQHLMGSFVIDCSYRNLHASCV